MPTRRIRDEERRRCPKACENCKRRKERCDGLTPCRRCVTRGVDAQCTFTPRPTVRSPAHFRSPESRSTVHGSVPAFQGSELSTTDILSTAVAPSPRRRRPSEMFHRSPAAPVPQLSRLIKDAHGKFMFIGDAANLSFLQIIRRIVSESVGSCPFVDDPLRNFMVEVSPAGRRNWISNIMSEPPAKPSVAEAHYFLHWYKLATNCILNLYDDGEPRTGLEQWATHATPEEQQDDAASAIYYLILSIGAQTCPEDKDELAERYFNYGRFLTTSSVMEDPSLSTVGSYVLITMYLLGASRRNAAFMYLGIAVRAAYALGIHRGDIGSLFSPVEYTIRERLWKGLRFLDLFLSSSLGRPPSTSETRGSSDQENYSATNDLSSIFEAILTEVYAKRMVTTEVLERISEKHRRWASRFADGLATDNIEFGEYLQSGDDGSKLPNIGLLHLKESYYYSIMLLSRPFLIESVSRQLSRAKVSVHLDHEAAPSSSPSDHLLAHACVDSAIRTIELLSPLLSSESVPKRLPLVINSLFVSALVLGLAVFADLDRVFPLEKSLAGAQRLLRKFSSHDAVGKRDSVIVNHLQAACDMYLERRARRRMERQGLLIGGLFGSVHNGVSVTTTTSLQEHQPQELPPRPAGQMLSPHTLGSVDDHAVQMIPDLATVTDMILPMSPRTLLFDSYEENMPLFPTVDASLIQFGDYQMEDAHTANLDQSSMLDGLG
ncbi:hypothetical protein DL546_003649 [Coniochaeta pulveracea]|uniref:Zn(2)-C6 fungal-type domain-containing protein n=1 Tax=Coniochaeta pulveracea TaxID=177199 RepID=A0A420Y0B7_9PEZI|nr:hypothetical protein DL546_003649 [Coniochaeta pulveracea]